jgi:glycogen debranching enzyme
VRDIEESGLLEGRYVPSTVDAPLWLYYTLQQLEGHVTQKEIWAKYGSVMKGILEAYRAGFYEDIRLHDNGLIWAWADCPLTWMGTIVDGHALTPRRGYPVELQALWYNAVSYTLALAKKQGDKEFVKAWKDIPERTKASFVEKFWMEEEGYLADYVNYDEQNRYIRCNMVVACGLDYKMLSEEQQVRTLQTIQNHLLTPRGLRTLSPRNVHYKSNYNEDQRSQDLASRNGSAWVWPLNFYVKACFDIAGERFLADAKRILEAFDEELQSKCVGSISERFEGDPPHGPRGSISHATSVAGLLSINTLIAKYEPKKAVRKSCKKSAPEAEVKEEKLKRKCVRKSVKK